MGRRQQVATPRSSCRRAPRYLATTPYQAQAAALSRCASQPAYRSGFDSFFGADARLQSPPPSPHTHTPSPLTLQPNPSPTASTSITPRPGAIARLLASHHPVPLTEYRREVVRTLLPMAPYLQGL